MEAEEILEKVDIVDYISQYCDLEEKNDGELWGLSPFTNEKTPSFSVSKELQRFYDFSSGCGGNVINFVRKYHKCGFLDAVDILKKYANITEESSQEKHLGCVMIAKRYLKNRRRATETKAHEDSMLADNYMERYEWDEEKLNVWKREGITVESMKKFGVRYDPFSDRIVFPIRNYDGKIINISGRTLDKDYKEKGIRKYTYFKKLGALDTIYGYAENKEEIEKKREIILFEGAKSVMIADGWGIHNTGAILTSHLNPNQLLFLVKLGVRVVFALDSDVNLTEDANIARLKRYVTVEWVKNRDNALREKMSPVDAGIDVWRTLYERKEPLR